MSQTAWKKFLNYIDGIFVSVKRLFSRSEEVAGPSEQLPSVEDKQPYIPRFLFKRFNCAYKSRKQAGRHELLFSCV